MAYLSCNVCAPHGGAAALLESSLSEAICARLEALELTRSRCDLNSQPETPTGLPWLSLDAQISNYEPRRRRGCAKAADVVTA